MAKISRSRASFRIGAELSVNPAGVMPDATVVTMALGIQPSNAHDAGTPKHGRPGSPLWKHGLWSLASSLPEESDLDVHLQWLLDRLLPARGRILQLLEADNRLRADFFCGLWLVEQHQADLSISPEILGGVGALRAELNLDIYSEAVSGAPPHQPSTL
jgi:Domain of unknown function (DUF4279)